MPARKEFMIKKLLTCIITLIIFLIPNAKATTISIEHLEDLYINMNSKNEKFNYYKDTQTNEPLYILDPITEVTNKTLKKEVDNLALIMNISNELLSKLQNITCFGYQYDNHQDISWYVATQYLIWQELGYDVKLMNENQKDVTANYQDLADKIINIIKDKTERPKFIQDKEEIHINYGERINFTKEEFARDYIVSRGANIKIINDQTAMYGSKPCKTNIIWSKIENAQAIPVLYYNENAKLINRTQSSIIYDIPVYIHGGKIKITNKDEEGTPISNTKYEIYNSSNVKVFSGTTNSLGKLETGNLPLDSYYILETETKDNYILNNNKISVEMIDFKTTEVLVTSNLKKAKIKIKLEYSLGDEIFNEEGAIFTIISEDNKKLEKTTNHLGEIEVLLPLGKYTIIQKYSKMNFEMQKSDFEIINYEDQIISFLNYQKTNKESQEETKNMTEVIKKEDSESLTTEEPIFENIIISDELENTKETTIVSVPNTFKNTSITFWLITGLILTLGIYLYAKD